MYLDVLEKIGQGINKPTNIMYRCNLSWRPFQEILRSLIEKGLIEEIEKYNRKYYVITKKGNETIFYLKKLILILHPVRNGKSVISDRNSELLISIRRDLNFPSILRPQERNKKEND